MEKRALLAIVLSLSVILLFQWYAGKHSPEQPDSPPSYARSIGQFEEAAPSFAKASEGKPEGRQPIAVEFPEFQPTSPPPAAKEEETLVETERFIITFTDIGGAIKKIELKDYPDPQTGEPLNLAQIENPRHNLAAIRDLYIIPDSDVAAYDLTRDGSQITYRYGRENFAIEKRYKLHNSLNHIELRIKFENFSGSEVSVDYGIIGGSSINRDEPFAARYVMVCSKVNGKVVKDKKDSLRPGEVSWIALKNKYFSILLKPSQFGKQSFTERIEKQNLLVGLKSAQFTIPTQGEVSHHYLYYIGPKDTSILKKYGMGLEEVVDYGVFGGISIVLLNILRFFHRLFHSWGVAIICVTLLMNLILYPLSRKSYQSMKQIQELQPHMEKLRQIHKDNPQKLQREMMGLYKKYKVNPMGGCLPLLLQMPIIIAMYQTIMRSIELKGSNFLWIKDLSEPDAVALPFSLPFLGNSVNILPILMVIAMILQQKLSPMAKGRGQSEQQKQQQTMMLFMPVIFGVIFYTLPSGLVLYWLVNTVLMMVNQHRVMKATPALTEG